MLVTYQIRHIPLEMDDILQDYVDEGELADAIAEYGERFRLMSRGSIGLTTIPCEGIL